MSDFKIFRGLVRKTALGAEIDAGIRTNFLIPDTHSIALGGGTEVCISANGQVHTLTSI